jgi:putative ABC transport system permease protein
MNLVGLALRNLGRRPVRTGLSILGIGLAVGGALALIALSRSIQDSSREAINELGDDFVVAQKGAADIFGGFIPESTIERVAALPGVARVAAQRADARLARHELPVEEGTAAGGTPAGAGRTPRRSAR